MKVLTETEWKEVEAKINKMEELEVLGVKKFIPPARLWMRRHVKHQFRNTMTKSFNKLAREKLL